jgi:hypothetical protein
MNGLDTIFELVESKEHAGKNTSATAKSAAAV